VPLVASKVDVSAHYRLVDVDRLAVGLGGKIALNGGTTLKGGFELTRDSGGITGTRTDAGLSLRLNPKTDVSAGMSLDQGSDGGAEVRTSVGVGYQLSGDASLRASYTLINFGTRPSPADGRHQASAEVSLRF
jgi:hypothetical protein